MTGFWGILSLLILVTGAGHSLAKSRRDPFVDQNEVENRQNIGPDFPYRRGETPIFNFDQGDEKFLETIPQLVKSLHHLADLTGKQQGIATKLKEAFQSCEECQH